MEPVQIRYRCSACSSLVTIGYPYMTSILADAATRHARGEPEDFKGDFVALVCEKCTVDPELAARLEALEAPQPIVEGDIRGDEPLA